MDQAYELYCWADPLFYDVPHRAHAAAPDFAVASRALPPNWVRGTRNHWLVFRPADVEMPLQGWKIHVSACLRNADDVLEKVWDYCTSRRVSFKFLRNARVMHVMNAKYAPRGSSGKLVTIYPIDVDDCERICRELSAVLAGQPGPDVLSDLRIDAGPLYVRYGGFAERYCEDADGQPVTAIEGAGGTLVPDRREPVFRVPDWVALPEFLVPHLAARGAVTIADLPYRIENALHFSNGGGVYAAIDRRCGERVVLKEARPHAGLSGDGADAVARLHRERDILARLAGLGVAPAVRDHFELGGHHFLVQELIEGQPLNTFFAREHPYVDREPSPSELTDYTAWALGICAGVERAVAAIHERGIVFNDLHAFNVMVRPDGSVALIDFEAAAHVDEGRRPVVGNPGFIAPHDRAGFAIDRYSLACLRLAIFLPSLTMLIPLDRTKATHLAALVAELFPVDREFLTEAEEEILGPGRRPAAPVPRPDLEPDGPGWARAREAMSRAIAASAAPSRADRLYPGDVRQFEPGGGLTLAHGAAGVLYAFAQTGTAWPPEHEEWFLDRAAEPPSGARVGLYDGMLGVAYVLEQLGHGSASLRLADICLSRLGGPAGLDLFGGLPGIALALAHLGDRLHEPALRDAAARTALMVSDRLAAGAGGRGAGLFHGPAGPALLFIRQYERTGDPGWLDQAAAALHTELDHCVETPAGSLSVDEGLRTMPYLARGSVGIGCVIDDYLTHRHDDRLAAAVPAIRRAARSPLYAQTGLLLGRAGMILYLSRRCRPGTAARDPDVAAQVRRLSWHALRYADGIAFPGDQLYRISMDLATGTAGVLLALGSALADPPARLPFLPPILEHRREGLRRPRPETHEKEVKQAHGAARPAGAGGTASLLHARGPEHQLAQRADLRAKLDQRDRLLLASG